MMKWSVTCLSPKIEGEDQRVLGVFHDTNIGGITEKIRKIFPEISSQVVYNIHVKNVTNDRIKVVKNYESKSVGLPSGKKDMRIKFEKKYAGVLN